MNNQLKQEVKEFLKWCNGSPDLTARDLANDYCIEGNYKMYQKWWSIYEYLKEDEDYEQTEDKYREVNIGL